MADTPTLDEHVPSAPARRLRRFTLEIAVSVQGVGVGDYFVVGAHENRCGALASAAEGKDGVIVGDAGVILGRRGGGEVLRVGRSC